MYLHYCFVLCTDISDRSDLYGVSGKSSGQGNQFNYQSFTFPGKGVYYHHQQSLQEDQGIDLTQVNNLITELISFFNAAYL